MTLCSSHILVETEEEADDVVARLDAGEDFAALAAELSLDTGSAAVGGDLGSSTRTRSCPSSSTAAAVGGAGISAPVQSQFGWHVIDVHSFEQPRRPTRPTSERGPQHAGVRGDARGSAGPDGLDRLPVRTLGRGLRRGGHRQPDARTGARRRGLTYVGTITVVGLGPADVAARPCHARRHRPPPAPVPADCRASRRNRRRGGNHVRRRV
ncbi:MAG: peptidylprolyl isomerase [Acidimicrobiales bacterium]